MAGAAAAREMAIRPVVLQQAPAPSSTLRGLSFHRGRQRQHPGGRGRPGRAGRSGCGRLDAGVALLSKPFRQADLARKVRQVLAKRIVAQAPEAAPSSEAPLKTAHPPRILLVEDQQDLRETTLQLLEMLECEAEGADSAESAEALLARSRFDVMITDVTLPGRSGIALAQSVHRDFADMKIVFCSGYGAPANVPPELKSWNLPKPYSLEELEGLLAKLGLR